MTSFEKYKYSPTIQPKIENAAAMRNMTIDYLESIGVKDPETIPPTVEGQLDRIESDPDFYAGFVDEQDVPVAFVKTSPWMYGDQAPFVPLLQALKLRKDSKLNGGILTPLEYGIPALNVEASLDQETRMYMFRTMLVHATTRAFEHTATAVNISLVNGDELEDLLLDEGFEATGQNGIVKAVPGVRQNLYKKKLRVDEAWFGTVRP
jgi:hypothetical protein